jgi:hypothetical protein
VGQRGWLIWQILSSSDIDDELRAWLQESHHVVGLQTDLADQIALPPMS